MELVSKINMRGGDLSDIPLVILCVFFLICIFSFYFIFLYFIFVFFTAYGAPIKKLVTMERALVIQLLYEWTMISKKYL